MDDHSDHGSVTHSADCDSCDYVAEVHAHSDDTAANDLSHDLATHNLEAHGQETDPDEIMDAVREKMRTNDKESMSEDEE